MLDAKLSAAEGEPAFEVMEVDCSFCDPSTCSRGGIGMGSAGLASAGIVIFRHGEADVVCLERRDGIAAAVFSMLELAAAFVMLQRFQIRQNHPSPVTKRQYRFL